MEAPALRWGILAPGWIARTMASDLREFTRQRIQAVGSRSTQRAQEFADEFDVPAAYGSYEELVADPEVDLVYVASPHSEHREHALLAIEAGKAVLVEKAFARNAAEAREVFDAAPCGPGSCRMWTWYASASRAACSARSTP
jgi:predicted dehydrogenase